MVANPNTLEWTVTAKPAACTAQLAVNDDSQLAPPVAPPPGYGAFAPALEDFEWDGPEMAESAAQHISVVLPAKPAVEVAGSAIASTRSGAVGANPRATAFAFDAKSPGASLRRRIRDRYIAARFPCTAQSSVDLEQVERVIKAARLFFEEEQADRALELLELARAQSPDDASLGLAQLEIAFLAREGPAFTTLALEFRARHPQSGEWTEIARLGRALVPGEPAFGDVTQAKAHAHYGPWPDTPNWIQASWDLTSEVDGADFHRAMRARRDGATLQLAAS